MASVVQMRRVHSFSWGVQHLSTITLWITTRAGVQVLLCSRSKVTPSIQLVRCVESDSRTDVAQDNFHFIMYTKRRIDPRDKNLFISDTQIKDPSAQSGVWRFGIYTSQRTSGCCDIKAEMMTFVFIDFPVQVTLKIYSCLNLTVIFLIIWQSYRYF